MDKYILTVDNGLTKSKAVILDLKGREVAVSVSNSDVENKNNNAEINMEKQWENTAGVICDVIKKSNIDNSQIISVANTAHGAGLYMIDKKGNPVRNAFSSMDKRGINIINKWEEEGKNIFDLTYQHMWNGQPIPYLYWVKENEPEKYKKTYKILMAKDWIKFKLTGKIATDYSDASNSGLLNAKTKKYDINILKPFGLEDLYEKLPEIYDSTEVIGKVTKKAAVETGLKAGTPVINGVYDVVACALGNGVYEDNQYSLVSGTWSINAGIVNNIKPNKHIMTWAVFADQNKYICFDASPTAAVNFEWYINNIIKTFGSTNMETGKIYEKVDNIMESIDPQNLDIIYVPFIYKSGLSKKMKGTFFGIDASNDNFDLIKAIHEGVVFGHLKHIENLNNGGIIKDEAVLSGGVTNSEFWCQLFADVLNIEIVTTQASQIGALGSAICAGVGVGEFSSFEEGVDIMVKKKDDYYPREKYVNIYKEKYKKFKHLIEVIDQYY